MSLRMFRRNFEHNNEVGRMSGSAKYATSGTGLIDRALVDRTCFKLLRLARTKPDDGKTVVEDLGKRLGQQHFITVPPRTLQEQTLE